jgi:hypothetical protein
VKDIKHESQRSDIRFVESPDKSSKAIAVLPKESQGDQGSLEPVLHSAPEARWEVSPNTVHLRNSRLHEQRECKPRRGEFIEPST